MKTGKIEEEAAAVCESIRRGDRAAVIRAALYAGKLSSFSKANSIGFVKMLCERMQITDEDLRRAGVPDSYDYALGFRRIE